MIFRALLFQLNYIIYLNLTIIQCLLSVVQLIDEHLNMQSQTIS